MSGIKKMLALATGGGDYPETREFEASVAASLEAPEPKPELYLMQGVQVSKLQATHRQALSKMKDTQVALVAEIERLNDQLKQTTAAINSTEAALKALGEYSPPMPKAPSRPYIPSAAEVVNHPSPPPAPMPGDRFRRVNPDDTTKPAA
jgi:hypothetical protein